MSEKNHCSFCGRDGARVEYLVAGIPDALICEDCVANAAAVIDKDKPKPFPPPDEPVLAEMGGKVYASFRNFILNLTSVDCIAQDDSNGDGFSHTVMFAGGGTCRVERLVADSLRRWMAANRLDAPPAAGKKTEWMAANRLEAE